MAIERMGNIKVHSLYEKLEEKIDTAPVSELLGVFRRLCNKLGLSDFEEWAKLEIEGYNSLHKIPGYRKVEVIYNTSKGLVLEYQDYPELKAHQFKEMCDGVEEIESFSKHEGLIHFRDFVELKDGGRVFLAAYPSTYRQVLTSIRSKLNEQFLKIDIDKLPINNTEEGVVEPLENQRESSDLHPLVIKASARLYNDGHYRNAILDAFIVLIDQIKIKSGRQDLDGVQLIDHVFSPKNPILIVSNDMDEQLGFAWLFKGAVMGIRNPKAHKYVEQMDPQRALEWLAFASVLCRVLDDSKLKEK